MDLDEDLEQGMKESDREEEEGAEPEIKVKDSVLATGGPGGRRPPGRGVGAPWVLPQGLTWGPPPGGPGRTPPGVLLLVYTHTQPVRVGFMSRSATLGPSHT